MTNAKRGRGSRHGVYFCAVAALGLALSACGGGGAGSGASPSQASSGANLPTGNGNGVTLNWAPPTQNTDGTPLTNLSGYEIYYGTASGNYTQSVSVSNAGLATYVVDNLSPGTYYFSVAAVNADGTESPLSPEVSATVN
jgi:hypothetical protein